MSGYDWKGDLRYWRDWSKAPGPFSSPPSDWWIWQQMWFALGHIYMADAMSRSQP